MQPREIIQRKRDGKRLTAEQMSAFLSAYLTGEAKDYHATSLLMAIYLNGMQSGEILDWTKAMLHSGDVLTWPDLGGPILDKHSTGGIGDKTSLILAPALVALGAKVPMISGRGLGHTGGTLDKLEAVPGLRTDLSLPELREQVIRLGLAFGAQTPELVPADREFYALRDSAGMVESIPLIVSSILSKKLAEGLHGLVLDVKCGSGAFLVEPEQGTKLALAMGRVAQGMGLPLRVVRSHMHEPLGRMVGNAMEVNECLDVMRGGGPEDLLDLTLHLGGELLHVGEVVFDPSEGRTALRSVLEDGRALKIFLDCLKSQGGDVAFGEHLPETGQEAFWEAPRAGYLQAADCRSVGWALLALGGAREVKGAPIDHQVGFEFLAKHGQRVEQGEPLVRVVSRAGKGLPAALEHLSRAYSIQDSAPDPLERPRTEHLPDSISRE